MRPYHGFGKGLERQNKDRGWPLGLPMVGKAGCEACATPDANPEPPTIRNVSRSTTHRRRGGRKREAGACLQVAKGYLRFMGQPVKLSESLVLDARLTGEVAERSIAGQIEFWAGLGRAVESLLRADKALALKKSGEIVPLSACLKAVNTRAGQARLAAVLAARPYPHFEPAAAPGLLVKIDEDGTRTTGRFINREFRPAKSR